MEKRKAAIFLDNLFLIVGIWLLAYLWTRYYVMNLLVALTVASAISAFAMMLIGLGRGRRRIKRKKQRAIDETMNQFLYGGSDFALDFFYTHLSKKYTTERKERCLLVEKTAVFCHFLPDPINPSDIIRDYVLAKKAGAEKIIALSIHGADKSAKQTVANLPNIRAVVFDKNKCYDFMGWLGSFPKITIVSTPQKLSAKKILSAALSRDKARRYFLISIMLMLSSYFVAYSIYYIISASATLLLAILAYVNISSKAKPDNSL